MERLTAQARAMKKETIRRAQQTIRRERAKLESIYRQFPQLLPQDIAEDMDADEWLDLYEEGRTTRANAIRGIQEDGEIEEEDDMSEKVIGVLEDARICLDVFARTPMTLPGSSYLGHAKEAIKNISDILGTTIGDFTQVTPNPPFGHICVDRATAHTIIAQLKLHNEGRSNSLVKYIQHELNKQEPPVVCGNQMEHAIITEAGAKVHRVEMIVNERRAHQVTPKEVTLKLSTTGPFDVDFFTERLMLNSNPVMVYFVERPANRTMNKAELEQCDKQFMANVMKKAGESLRESMRVKFADPNFKVTPLQPNLSQLLDQYDNIVGEIVKHARRQTSNQEAAASTDSAEQVREGAQGLRDR